MTSDGVEDRVEDTMREFKFEIITTNLSKEQEERLHEVFAEEVAAPAR